MDQSMCLRVTIFLVLAAAAEASTFNEIPKNHNEVISSLISLLQQSYAVAVKMDENLASIADSERTKVQILRGIQDNLQTSTPTSQEWKELFKAMSEHYNAA